MIRILYVEDEPFLGKVVKEALESKGYEICWIQDGSQVMSQFSRFSPDLCVLDIMLPGKDGFEISREIRLTRPKLPVIFLSAKAEIKDLEQGFETGANDYLRKPFSVEELVLRINNQLRMSKGDQSTEASAIKRIGIFEFHTLHYELKSPTMVIKLSHRESQILNRFSENVNAVIDRRELLKEVWGDDSFFNSRTLDVYIRKIREYLSEDPNLEIITLKGRGYHFSIRTG